MNPMPALAVLLALTAMPVLAWSPQGHETVGAIADRLLEDKPAGREVRRILGEERLQQAVLWADCVKSVREREPHRYVESTRYPECAPYQTRDGEREMEDYVVRNLSACRPEPGQESCHKQYHYADVTVQREAYAKGLVGTSDHDIVAAINACIEVLEGGTAPAPFSIRSQREALRLLAHLVGDLHQPLHVGVVYLDAEGRPVDPDRDGLDAGSDTHGGNALVAADGARLHARWDGIPARLHAGVFADAGADLAKAVPRTERETRAWAASWANETLALSRSVHAGLTYGPAARAASGQVSWTVAESARPAVPSDQLKKRQLVKAGARLAQLLEAVWPR